MTPASPRAEPSSRLRLEPVARLEDIEDEWRTLVEAAHTGIFSTWEWADAWWRSFGHGRELAVHACRDEQGTLVAVLPLYVRRFAGLAVARFLGHGPADELGPIHARGGHESAAEALLRAVAGVGADVLAAEQLPGDEGWPALLGQPLWRREANPVLDVPDAGWDAFLATRSANQRQQIARRERSLARSGRLRFRLADAATLERDVDTLFALHAARWAGRRSDFEDAPFHRDVARRALSRGWLRLWVLELDDRPLAAWHGFHVAGITSYYQAGRDPAFDRHAVGGILLVHTIREAMAEGATEYRFGRGDEPFKYRLADRDPGLDTIVAARSRRGRALAAGARAVRVARRLRRRAGA